MKWSRLRTAYHLAKNIKTTGALYQTSRKVEAYITSKISLEPNKVYVEFGVGHGNITRKILEKMHASSTLYSFEINKAFCEHVGNNIQDDRLNIINASAADIATYIDQPVDAIVSSLPLTIFKKDLQTDILTAANEALRQGAFFSQILYTKRMQTRFREIFSSLDIKFILNVPLEYIFYCKKK